MQRWNGFAKDNGDIKVTPGFEYRDMFDNADITHYECIGSILHVGQSFKHGHYFAQKKIGKLINFVQSKDWMDKNIQKYL